MKDLRLLGVAHSRFKLLKASLERFVGSVASN